MSDCKSNSRTGTELVFNYAIMHLSMLRQGGGKARDLIDSTLPYVAYLQNPFVPGVGVIDQIMV